MTRIFAASVLALAASVCSAQDMGRVISSTPVMQQVGVPRQVCSTEQVAVQPPKSGAGALMGAVAGGAIGNSVGSGSGRALAAFAGLIGGALLGDRIEGNGPAQVQNVQHCSTQTFLENSVVAYNVLYEFAGKQYSVQMPNDPGPTIRVQVTPVGSVSRDGSQLVGASNYPPPVQAPVAVNNRWWFPYDARKAAPLTGGEVNPGY